MFNFFKNKRAIRKDELDSLMQSINQLNENISQLIWQNSELLNEKNAKRSVSGDFGQQNKQYTSYEKGYMSKAKDFFDSPAEHILEGYLDVILSKYKLGYYFGIRVVAHQPLCNYVQQTKIKKVNERNAFMHFDFVFEWRRPVKGKITDNMAGHFPLLVIELNGKTHEQEEQKERDEYKRGVCAKLNIPCIAIQYQKEQFKQEDIEKVYLQEIMTGIFMSIYHWSLINADISKYSSLLAKEKTSILNKYPKDEFPEMHLWVNQAYDYVYSAYSQRAKVLSAD